MTRTELDRRLQLVDPKLHLRERGWGDIVGVFYGSEYLFRIGKGEINFNGYRYIMTDPNLNHTQGTPMKRGRKTLTRLLSRYIKTDAQRTSLLWGL